jgi:hypothetical protein
MNTSQFEVGKHDLQFQCDWAVFPKNSNSSLCYTTSKERAEFITNTLNQLKELQQAIDEAAHIISSVGTTGIHDKTKQAQQWLEKYT